MLPSPKGEPVLSREKVGITRPSASGEGALSQCVDRHRRIHQPVRRSVDGACDRRRRGPHVLLVEGVRGHFASQSPLGCGFAAQPCEAIKPESPTGLPGFIASPFSVEPVKKLILLIFATLHLP